MKTKQEIIQNWLPRYTERPLKDFTDLILLTNIPGKELISKPST